jgi:ADP-ribose pyrophosphatase YjhB (NUDIX family)
MRSTARAIVVYNQNILVMKRNKFGQEYYCLVGGAIDKGETADQAVVREIREETSLKVGPPQLVYIEEAGEPYGTQYIFICQYLDGEVHLQPDSIEAQLNKLGQNTFLPMWLPVSKFASAPFESKQLQAEILTGLRDGFPSQPKSFRSGTIVNNAINSN